MADWHDMALDVYLKQGLGADKISRELGLPFGAVNSFLYRWRKRNGGAPGKDASVDLSERLLSILKKKLGTEFEASDLCNRLGVSKRVLQATIEDLREQALIEFIRKQVQFGTVTIFVQDSQPIRIETGIRSVKLG